MNRVKVLVVDDEIIIAQNICDNLSALGYETIEPVINYTEGLRRIKEENPDIAILDINLSGKKTGIDLAKEIRKYFDFPFLFLTSHTDQTTIETAKHTMPSAYLIKPFTKEELYSSIEIALHNYAFENDEFSHQDDKPLIIKNSFFVKEKNVFVKINFDDIAYLRSAHVYIDLVLINKKEYLIRGSLSGILNKLSDDFVRIHRSYIVNSKHLTKIDNTSVTIEGEQLSIGNKYREDLLKRIIIV